MTTYSDASTPSGQATFHVPYRVARPGDRFRINIGHDVPRLEIDRDDDSTYEESWMPEVTVVEKSVDDWAPPVTKARVKKIASLGDQLMLSLEA